MHKRHRRALRVTALLALVLSAPIFYLYKLNVDNRLAQLEDLGPVGEFAFGTADGQSAFTHFDTEKRVTVIFFVPKECKEECLTSRLNDAEQLMTWAEENLQNKNIRDVKPQAIQFVWVSEYSMENFNAKHFNKTVFLSGDEHLPLPEQAKAVQAPRYLVIDQDAHYRAALEVGVEDQEVQMRRLLSKLTSENFLVHYLVQQNLMWKKVKDYTRGIIR